MADLEHSFSPVPADTEDVTRDLQDRVGRLGRAVFAIVALMGAASIFTHVATHEGAESGGLSHELVHAGTLVPALVVWLRCRGKLMQKSYVEALDVGLTLTACTLYALLGLSATTSLSVAFSIVLATTYTLVGRSIVVPSSLRRTLVISLLGIAPIVLYFAVQGVSARFEHSPESGRIFSLFGMLWCGLAVVAASANSRQLYGLRSQIREIGRLGQYTLKEKIGEGGMGAVYRATHTMLRRPAAIKLLLKERSSEKEQARFEREVQLTSRLAHPNTISIFDYGRTADGVFYYVMEYLDGLDLDKLVKENGPLPPARVIHILKQVCGALGEAHQLGLVHRDIKPANIVLTERIDEPDIVKVVDFGLARPLERSEGAESRVGTIAGTPLYLSPEAIQTPESIDGRADIYALGAVAYFLLTGKHVFEGQTVVELLSKHMIAEPAAPSTHLPTPLAADFERVVLSCLAKDREQRPATVAVLASALDACADASRYDVSAAAAWWRERRAQQRPAAEPAAPGMTATMAIDLRHRADVSERAS